VAFFDCFSSFGIRFSLRRPPAKPILEQLLETLKSGKHPVITIKYYGFASDQKPLYATCTEVQNGCSILTNYGSITLKQFGKTSSGIG
jgi:hypothetical protein